MDMTQDHLAPPNDSDGNTPLSHEEFLGFIREIEFQPPWRAKADKEMDYLDGNQLDSELLRKQQALGIPPAEVQRLIKAGGYSSLELMKMREKIYYYGKKSRRKLWLPGEH